MNIHQRPIIEMRDGAIYELDRITKRVWEKFPLKARQCRGFENSEYGKLIDRADTLHTKIFAWSVCINSRRL